MIPHRVHVGIPSTDEWKADTANCIMQAAAYASSRGVKVRINNVRNSRVSELRNQIVENALNADATHIMWIDSDMVFPAHAIHTLLTNRPPVVGCTYRKRRPDYRFIHEEATPERETRYGLREVDSLPGGFVLVDTRVYRTIGSGAYNEVGSRGEDYSFCDKARAKGFQPTLDTELSSQISHIGQMRVPHDIPPEVLNWLRKTQG